MGLFGKKKTPEEIVAEAKRAEYEKILRMSKIKVPTKTEAFTKVPRTTEYRQFLAEIKAQPKTYFERAAALAERIMPIKPSADMEEKLNDDIKTAYMIATPTGVLSLMAFTIIILLPFAMLGILFGLGMTFGMFLFGGVFGAAYYVYSYPKTMARVTLMRMSSDTVLAILYMVIFLRTSPSIEGGLKFAAENLEGPLAWDLRKLLWDIEVGTYASADAALISYVERWKNYNKEFTEAINLLRGIAVEPTKREVIYQETLGVILNGTRERAKHYASELRMPMMLIHAMGVLLPIMGLVLFPIVLIFMSESVKPSFIAIGYDILLPAALLIFMSHVLATKPPTFSQPDISKCKSAPPMGSFLFGGTLIPVYPIAFAVATPVAFIGILGMGSTNPVTAVNSSVVLIFSLALGISVYCLLDAWQKMKIRKDIEKVEEEFGVALFQLGNILSSGIPLEMAIDRATVALKDLKIAELFKLASMNMKKFGMTFDDAMFDSEVGAIWQYPSKIITSIMTVILEASKKSVSAAADSMVVIATYLKGVHDVKEEIAEIMGETLSSMKFLAMFLAPMVAGVTITMAVVILEILKSMGSTISQIVNTGGAGMTPMQNMLFFGPGMMGGNMPINGPTFQLVVGLYMVEMALLLAMFTNRIEYGDDKIGERSTTGTTLLIAMVVYIMTWLISYSMFGPMVQSILTPAGI